MLYAFFLLLFQYIYFEEESSDPSKTSNLVTMQWTSLNILH